MDTLNIQGLRSGRSHSTLASFLMSLFLFGGCGAALTDANSVPEFTSASTVSVHENILEVTQFDAVDADGDSLTYGIEGEDASSFEVDAHDGTLSFLDRTDFETRESYELTAVVSDGKSAVTMDVTVNIKDSYFMDQTKMVPDDAERYDDFGNTVAMDGDYIVIGANDEDDITDGAGSVYVYRITSDHQVVQLAKLQAENAEEDDAFGDSVAIDGDYIVVGASHEDTSATDAGHAYVYKIGEGDSVTQIAKLQASDAEAYDGFGSSVALDGDLIVIGAPKEDTTAEDAGSVYLFKRLSDDTIVQKRKFQAGDTGIYDLFGLAVGVDAGHIIVGSRFEDTTADGAGSAYVFEISAEETVTQIAKLQADDAQKDDHFGDAVAIDGDYLLVSSPEKDSGAKDAGSVYLFKIPLSGPIESIATLQAVDADADDRFGLSLAIDGEYIAVGSRYDDTTAVDTGSTTLFRRIADDTIVQIEKREAFDAAERDSFGAAVAISGDRLIVTAPYDDTLATNTGSAYLFIKDPDELP